MRARHDATGRVAAIPIDRFADFETCVFLSIFCYSYHYTTRQRLLRGIVRPLFSEISVKVSHFLPNFPNLPPLCRSKNQPTT